MEKLNILLVEDDPNLGTMLSEYLDIKGGYEITLINDGKEAMNALLTKRFDICLFDVMLPSIDGFDLAVHARKLNPEIPIIFITAKSQLDDKKRGFDVGGDDYLCKPFSMEELIMRIQAVMKRTSDGKINGKSRGIYELGITQFDYPSRKLTIHNKKHSLTTKESELLKILLDYKDEVVERKTMLKRIWNDDNYFNARSMDVYLSKLRKVLSSDTSIEVMNIHGVGYKLIQR